MKPLLLATAAVIAFSGAAAAQATKAPATGCQLGTSLCTGPSVGVEFGGVGASPTSSGAVSATAAILGVTADYTVWNGGFSVPWMVDFHLAVQADGTTGTTTWNTIEEIQLGGSLAGVFTSPNAQAPSQGPVLTGLGAAIPFGSFVSDQHAKVGGGLLQGWGWGVGSKFPIGINWTLTTEYRDVRFQNPGLLDPTEIRSALVGLTYHFN